MYNLKLYARIWFLSRYRRIEAEYGRFAFKTPRKEVRSMESENRIDIAEKAQSWQERVELSRAESALSQEPKRQRAPHYIKVVTDGQRYIDVSRAVRKEWVLCPDCKNGYHGH